ncbi:hypothetical protein OAL67_01340, partial [bacterium]|nr:hypothetical protein [bacterium]
QEQEEVVAEAADTVLEEESGEDGDGLGGVPPANVEDGTDEEEGSDGGSSDGGDEGEGTDGETDETV